jgi:hypothetical protein
MNLNTTERSSPAKRVRSPYILAIFITLLTGCFNTTQLRSHRPVKDHNHIRIGYNYLMSTVEFDDMGELWDPAQLTNTLRAIHMLKTNGWVGFQKDFPDARMNEDINKPRPVISLVFVHGWNNDASDRSKYFSQFRSFIAQYASMVSDVYKTNPPVVVGTFIGWRGALYQTTRDEPSQVNLNSPQNLFRFYNRKAAAERVAGPAATSAILAICAESKTDRHPNMFPSRAIVIGHSFGGLIVERAVSQAVLGSLLIDRVDINVLRQEQERDRALSEGKRTELAKYQQEIPKLDREMERLGLKLSDTNRLASLIVARTNEVLKKRDLLFKSSNMLEEFQKERLKKSELLTNNVDGLIEELAALRKTLKVHLESRGAIFTNWNPQIQEVVGNLSSRINDQISDVARHLPMEATVFVGRLVGVAHDVDFGSAGATVADSLTNGIPSLVNESIKLTNQVTAYNRALFDFHAINNEISQKSATNTAFRKELQTAELSLNEASSWRSNLVRLDWLQKRTNNLPGEIKDIDKQVFKRSRPAPQPADLVVLVNPASEAITAKKMIDSFRYIPQLSSNAFRFDHPLVIAVSSGGDLSTRMLFPVAMGLSSMTKSFRPDRPQARYLLSTAPHVADLQSHSITNIGWMCPGPNGHSFNYQQILRFNLSPDTKTLGRLEFAGFAKSESGNQQRAADSIYKFQITETGQNPTAYWVVRAPPSIIRGHKDIFTDQFICLITGLIRSSGVLLPESQLE